VKHRFITFGAAGALALIVAVGAFASQDPISMIAEDPVDATETPVVDATETPEATATGEPEATTTPEPTATGEPDATATGEPDATETPLPDATTTPEPEPTEDGGDDGIRGIPEDHPVFKEDDDGVCEKHEWRVKTTPSGNQVRVPCHAAGGDDGEEGAGGTSAEDESPKKGKGHGKGRRS
jgi:hypothetical protein